MCTACTQNTRINGIGRPEKCTTAKIIDLFPSFCAKIVHFKWNESQVQCEWFSVQKILTGNALEILCCLLVSMLLAASQLYFDGRTWQVRWVNFHLKKLFGQHTHHRDQSIPSRFRTKTNGIQLLCLCWLWICLWLCRRWRFNDLFCVFSIGYFSVWCVRYGTIGPSGICTDNLCVFRPHNKFNSAHLLTQSLF